MHLQLENILYAYLAYRAYKNYEKAGGRLDFQNNTSFSLLLAIILAFYSYWLYFHWMSDKLFLPGAAIYLYLLARYTFSIRKPHLLPFSLAASFLMPVVSTLLFLRTFFPQVSYEFAGILYLLGMVGVGIGATAALLKAVEAKVVEEKPRLVYLPAAGVGLATFLGVSLFGAVWNYHDAPIPVFYDYVYWGILAFLGMVLAVVLRGRILIKGLCVVLGTLLIFVGYIHLNLPKMGIEYYIQTWLKMLLPALLLLAWAVWRELKHIEWNDL
ncbi:MAG TPA: hypothetical protein VKV18_04140 [Chthonomonas sp.]|uniref:hypothetical protein n=1 Tax=Chthonomonas sp. TaxID=2282153 RepID=UPI002B4B4501|nr:hypothetical protein [Chthonomonas sp.]HLI47865.1 hypothetical protein [Chthonomonas sp.]